MWFNNGMFSKMQSSQQADAAAKRSAVLLTSIGAAAIVACLGAYYWYRRQHSAPPAITSQQAAILVSSLHFGKSSVGKEVDWLCHLLDGKSSHGTPFRPHQCGWQAARLSPSLWRVEYDDRGVTLDGRPTASDKIWLLDTSTWEIQPRTITTMMITAPELAGVPSKKDLNDRFFALTGRPFTDRAATMNLEIDTLPRWQVNHNGTLTRR